MIVKIKTFSGETLYLPEEDYLNEVMYSDLEEREFASRRAMKKVGNYILDAQLGGRELSPRAKGFIKKTITSKGVYRDMPNITEVKKAIPMNQYKKLGLTEDHILGIKKQAEEMARGKSIPERRKMTMDVYKKMGYI